MSTITIKDLTENTALDRKAMLAIVGGARRGGYSLPLETQSPAAVRLVNYPSGFGRIPLYPGKPRG